MSDAETPKEKPTKVKRTQSVFTLLVQVGRKDGDGLPEKATGGGLMIYASGVDEAEAVRLAEEAAQAAEQAQTLEPKGTPQ